MKVGFVSIIFCWFSFLPGFQGGEPSAREIARDMFASCEKIRSMEYRMVKKERIEGEMKRQESSIKLNIHPYEVYVRQSSPKDGVEILYSEGKNHNKALVNTNGFPWFTMKLSPMGSTMRDEQHHTILQSGYGYVVTILEFLFNKYEGELDDLLTKLPPVRWQGEPCYALKFENPHFKYIRHTVKEGETLESICNERKIGEYMVLQLNESLDDFDDELDPGDVIRIPNDYSPKMIIYIDRNRLIPLMMKIFDDKGVYEVYEYYDVTLNPWFLPDTFSSTNDNYDF